MQFRQHNLRSGNTLFRVHIDRNSAAVVDYRDGIIDVNSSADFRAVTSQSLINRVVHHFVYKVM